MANNKSKSTKSVMPSVPAAAVMSFLKDTRGLMNWTTRDLSKSLGIEAAEADKVLTIMEMQGYVKPAEGGREWFTTAEGQAVSASKLPHFKRERVEAALEGLKQRIAARGKISNRRSRLRLRWHSVTFSATSPACKLRTLALSWFRARVARMIKYPRPKIRRAGPS